MASLTGQLVAETYKALLKTIDNDILTASEKQITDGLGGGSNVFIDSQGFLRANKYKVTNGLATQFLKADGSLDANTYLTGITSSQIITALGYTPVPTTRTLTINGTTYDLSANRSWTVAGTAAVWGNISGTLSNQTDLQTALNAKYNNPTGTISQYIRGDGSLATFPTLPGGLPTGGTAGQILAKIDATDYNTHWIDNFATQTKNEVKLGATLAKGTAVYVSGSTGGSGTNMIVMAASNASEALSSKTFGLLETGGATNDLVKCVTFGLLAGLDTSTAQAGDPVWLGVNGALLFGLANKPVAPANMVYIGVVTRVQSNNGEIFVNVQNGFEIEELHDVLIQSKANNQGLFYESSTGLWKNKSIATVLGYTPQAQLDGTGFVKASGTTISYDNSTYLTTADAASTYQRLDRMAINLLASDIQYPNNNAVIAALALKANAANPVFTGNMTISGAEPKLFFTDTDNNPDYTVFIDSGVFFIYDQTAGATRFSISSTGNISSGVGKSITAGSFVKESGLATQFLKADGSIDSSTYVTSTALADYLLITTAASTYQRLDRIASSLFASATNYPNNNAVIAGLALKADAANPVFTGSMNIQGLESRINFYDENNLRKFFIGYSSGQLSIYQDAGSATRFVINSSGNITTGVNNTITSWGFIKSGGTSSQFLLADGSVTTSVVAGSGTTGYHAKWTSGSAIGNGIIYDNGSSIGISTITPFNGINNTGLNIQRGGHSTLLLGDGFTYGGVVQSSDDIKRVFVGANIYDDVSGGWSQFVDGSGYGAVDVISESGGGMVRFVIGSGNDSGYNSPNIFLEAYKNNSNSYFKIRTNTDNAIYISNSGNVGLNTSTDSGYKLDVVGTGRFSERLITKNATTGTGLLTNLAVMGAGEFLATGSLGGFFFEDRSGGVTSTTNWYGWYALSGAVKLWNGSTNIMSINGTNGATTFSNSITATRYYITPSGTANLYNIVDSDSSFAGSYTMQAGGGSSGFGGAILVYGHSHATKPGWITAGISASSGGKFTVNTQALGGGTDIFTVQQNGNVLVGTTTDSGFKFEVNGAVKFNSTLSTTGNIQIDATSPLFISNASSSTYFGGLSIRNSGIEKARFAANSASGAYVYSPTFNGFGILSDTINPLVIASNGNVSIGATNFIYSPKLAINSVGQNSLAIQTTDAIQGSTGTILYIGTGATTGNSTYGVIRALGDGGTAATNLILQPSGFVGIGTTTVNNKLQVGTNGALGSWMAATFQEGIGVAPSGSRKGVYLYSDGSSLFGMNAYDYGNSVYKNVTVGWGGANVILAQDGGSVGLGTSSPSFKFHVVGTGATGWLSQLQNNNKVDTYISHYDGYGMAIDSASNSEIYLLKLSGGNGSQKATNDRFKVNGNGCVLVNNSSAVSGRISAASLQVTNEVYSRGSFGGYFWEDRSNSANWGGWYTNSGVTYLWNGSSNIMNINMSSGAITASAFFESSDFRLKTLIEHNPIVAGIDNLEAKLYEKNGKIELGYFAQDVEKIMPYAVTKNADGFLNLSYREVHTAKIARLEKEVAELKAKLNAA
jgi:hypothetical protein